MLYMNYQHRRHWLRAAETDTATPKNDRHLNESDAERFMGSQSDYSLGNPFKCLHHDRRSLLSPSESGY